jgi:hypothetical protein
LDAVISRAQLEKKVADYLRNSQELEDYWDRPAAPEQLQAEMDRMAKQTKQPRVLRELFAALGNDPFVIAECLASPVLTERLLSNQYERADRGPRQRTEVGLKESSPVKTENQMSDTATMPNSGYSLPTIADVAGGCAVNTWTATAISPAGRNSHTAVWTGSEMIIWGGADTFSLGTGARYNPVTNSWTATSTTNAPSERARHTAVWTGTEMIIWGGHGPTNAGGRYNPSTDSWTTTSNINADCARASRSGLDWQ